MVTTHRMPDGAKNQAHHFWSSPRRRTDEVQSDPSQNPLYEHQPGEEQNVLLCIVIWQVRGDLVGNRNQLCDVKEDNLRETHFFSFDRG
jgi:hypothetical protein